MWRLVQDDLAEPLNRSGDVAFSPVRSVRERRQVEKGGIDAIPATLVDVADLLPASSSDH